MQLYNPLEIPEDSVRVRASGLARAFDCAYAWEGIALLGMTMPSSPRALLGSAVHHGTAVFDTARMEGNPIRVGDAAGVVVDMIRQPEEEVDWRGSELRPQHVEGIALDLYTRYCQEWSPRFDFAAVETAVKPVTIDCGGGVKVTLTGTLDRNRVVRTTGRKRMLDLKSGARAVENGRAVTQKHRAQLGVYVVLDELSLGEELDEVTEVLGMQTTGRRPIALGETRGAKELVLGPADGAWPGYLELLADDLRRGRFKPNTQSQLCSPQYCPRWATCPYHE